ncbi:phosphate acyltransferase PlsX [Mesomycoplasma lagogenitalium]|uniref:Phosphate acyltransferase n=1 Tax=Mesomycoplasma lagogenitalium TaxID=171286 RepID=A0ABY8LSW3_9BACT|nr:phosphate acyltransferase PlsX [Mesomycoplasma lagogenitalium]WGI36351.1 phosphate acyltransferase PlsX [Mesomycoplasma lagogenitalium]
MEQKIIAFDLMGTDGGVKPGIDATLTFLKQNPDYKIVLIGDEVEIKKNLPADFNKKQIEIINEKNVAKMKDNNARTLLKENSSMMSALNLIAENKASSVLSAGDSGTYLALATLKLKRINNVSRAAFMPMIPTLIENKYFLLLDAGANLEVKPEYFEQWALISSIFYKFLFKKENPSVGIINIGTEEYKGFEYHKQANELLKNNLNVNYKGFIETRDLLQGNIDIALADGYAGNITLKTMEGTVLNFSKLMKEKLMKNFFRKIGALILKSAFKEVKERFDYRNVGAAWVIGVNGIVIKSHGSSDAKAYLGALNQIKIAIESQVLTKIIKALE